MAIIERMHWLASPSLWFDLYKDQNSLVFIFDPLAVQPGLREISVGKCLRWQFRLSGCSYVCIHIKSRTNIWAKTLSRWSTPETLIIRRFIVIPTVSSNSDPSFALPDTTESATIQSSPTRPLSVHLESALWHTSPGGLEYQTTLTNYNSVYLPSRIPELLFSAVLKVKFKPWNTASNGLLFTMTFVCL